MIRKSMSLKYEPSLEPLHISAKLFLLNFKNDFWQVKQPDVKKKTAPIGSDRPAAPVAAHAPAYAQVKTDFLWKSGNENY